MPYFIMDDIEIPEISRTASFSHLISTYDSDSLNHKVVYRENFPSVLPDRQQESAVLTSILLVDELALDSALYELHLGDETLVDVRRSSCSFSARHTDRRCTRSRRP